MRLGRQEAAVAGERGGGRGERCQARDEGGESGAAHGAWHRIERGIGEPGGPAGRCERAVRGLRQRHPAASRRRLSARRAHARVRARAREGGAARLLAVAVALHGSGGDIPQARHGRRRLRRGRRPPRHEPRAPPGRAPFALSCAVVAVVEHARPRRLGLLQAGTSLAALGAIAWWASRQHAPHVALDPGAVAKLAAALGVYAVATALRGERWHNILRAAGIRPGRRTSYGLTLVGYMGNNTLPARAGDVMRVVLLRGSRRAVLGTVVAERALDAAALALIFGVVVLERGLAFGPLPYLVAIGAAV